MAIFTQILNGNLSNPAIWDLGAVPGEGDQIASDSFDLTIDTNLTLGADNESGNWLDQYYSDLTDDSSIAILSKYGSLTIDSGVTITLKGDLIGINTAVSLEEGCKVYIDASGAPGVCDADKFYVVDVGITYGQDHRLGCINFNGTEDNPIDFHCIGGTSFFLSGQAGHVNNGYVGQSSGNIDSSWVHFKNFGAIPALLATDEIEFESSRLAAVGYSYGNIIRSWAPSLALEGTSRVHPTQMIFQMSNVVLESTTGVGGDGWETQSGSLTNLVFYRVRAKNTKYWCHGETFISINHTYDVSEAPSFADDHNLPSDVPIRSMIECSFDRYIEFIDGAIGWMFNINLFAGGFSIPGGKNFAPISFRKNIVVRSDVWGFPTAEEENQIPDEWTSDLAELYGSSLITTPSIAFQNLPYGTGSRDPNIPESILNSGMDIGSWVESNYFIEDSGESNPHVLQLSYGNGDGAHIAIGNIFEVDRCNGEGESIVGAPIYSAERTTPTQDTGALFFVGNIQLPSVNGGSPGTFWVTPFYSDYPDGHSLAGESVLGATWPSESEDCGGFHYGGYLPSIYTNNIFYLGDGEGAINTSEHGYYYDEVRYCKNNIFWDRLVRTTTWAVGDVSSKPHPDLVLPENVDYNIKINLPYDPDLTHEADTTESNIGSTDYNFYNNNGYRGLELLDGTTLVDDVRRLNTFGLNDLEFNISDTEMLPFVNHYVNSGYYAKSKINLQSVATTWQMIAKEFDWTDENKNSDFTRMSLFEYIQNNAAPTVSSENFTSALDPYQSHQDPNLLEGGNPLGAWGNLQYTADSGLNKMLIALNGLYSGTGALDFKNPNSAPVAVNDIFTTNTDVALVITYDEILDNDSDPDNVDEVLSIVSFGTPSNGSLANNSISKEITYTPINGYYGSDSFTYKVTDIGGKSATGTITISVVNQAPVASDLTLEVESNTILIIPKADFLADAIDVDGDDSVIAFYACLTPDNGTITISGDNVMYSPNTDFTGIDQFNYHIIDEAGQIGTGTATVIVQAGAGLVSVLTSQERTLLENTLSLSHFIALK